MNDQIAELKAAGKTYAEIADALGMTQQAVRGRWRRMGASSTPAKHSIEQASRDEQRRLQNKLDAELRARALRDVALTDALIEAVARVTPLVPRATIPVLPAPKASKKPQVALAMISDLHIGALADPEETGGYGSYNLEIARERIKRLQAGIRSITNGYHRPVHSVSHLVAPLLGDLIDNVEIFASQGELVDADLMLQVLTCIEMLSEFFVGLLDTFETIFIPVVTGNHGRIGRKGQHKRHINWDYLIGHILKMKLEPYAERITVEVPKAPFMVIDILGWKFLLRHGDGIKSWGGIPYYGIQRSTGRWIAIQAAYGQRFDYMLMGHLHSPAHLPFTGGEVIINGSVIGTNEYSVEVIESLNRPSQFFGFVHPDHGLGARYPIFLDTPSDASHPKHIPTEE